DQTIPFTVRETVAVLHGNDRHNFAGSLKMLHSDIGEADVPYLACTLQLRQRVHGCIERNRRIGYMKLIDIDPLQPQSFQASLNRRFQMLWRGVVSPLAGADAFPPAF